ncbi:hypothetical protein [Ideonella sp.]|uniref:hypothetical protein n=1 Tax=Ideonella sp. TaxID=1929293 RepID=UPI0035ADDD67
MNPNPADPVFDPPPDPALDDALSRALPPPALPAGFHARLQAAMVAEAAHDLAQQRRELEEEHARRLAALERGYVRLKRDTLATVIAAAFTAGAVVQWGVPWLHATLGIDLSSLVPLLALVIGLAVGAGVWVERFGFPRAWLRRLLG